MKSDSPTPRPSKTWMLVERLENWQVDQDAGFSIFGLPDHLERRARCISTGERLLVYVSSDVSSFADVRRVTSDKLEKLRFGGDYDMAFPFCIRTESVFVLTRSDWVPIKPLIDQLSFTKGKRDWRQVMRTALRVLREEDAELILDSMQEARLHAA